MFGCGHGGGMGMNITAQVPQGKSVKLNPSMLVSSGRIGSGCVWLRTNCYDSTRTVPRAACDGLQHLERAEQVLVDAHQRACDLSWIWRFLLCL